MRSLLLPSLLVTSAFILAGCGGDNTSTTTTTTNAATTTNTTTTTTNAAPSSAPVSNTAAASPANDNAPPVSSAHGAQGGLPPSASTSAPAAAMSNAGEADRAALDTKELDRKITQAEAKAKAKSAREADKRAAAEAYFERGYKYYSAQNPKLYKYALGDFRRVLKYQPDHAEARQIIDQIEGIYRQMGRDIPTNGLEP